MALCALLLPKWSGDLKYGPCPPARDFGSRVSGLVMIARLTTSSLIRVVAFSKATSVAVVAAFAAALDADSFNISK